MVLVQNQESIKSTAEESSTILQKIHLIDEDCVSIFTFKLCSDDDVMVTIQIQ
jgi:hypothetical protein